MAYRYGQRHQQSGSQAVPDILFQNQTAGLCNGQAGPNLLGFIRSRMNGFPLPDPGRGFVEDKLRGNDSLPIFSILSKITNSYTIKLKVS